MASLCDVHELRAALGVAAAVVPDDRLEQYCAAATDEVLPYLKRDQSHDGHPGDRLAALTIAVDMWQSVTAAGGQNVAIDYTPGPYRMGKSLLSKVSGLIAPCRSVRNLVG